MNVIDRPDTVVLDETILDDEPACQIRHSKTICSQEVTHIITGCKGPFLSCAKAAESKKRLIAERRAICTCGKFAEDCWQVHPV